MSDPVKSEAFMRDGELNRIFDILFFYVIPSFRGVLRIRNKKSGQLISKDRLSTVDYDIYHLKIYTLGTGYE